MSQKCLVRAFPTYSGQFLAYVGPVRPSCKLFAQVHVVWQSNEIVVIEDNLKKLVKIDRLGDFSR